MSAVETGPSATDDGGFSPKVVLALLLVCVLAMAAFLVLAAYAPDLRAATNGGGDVLSPSAVGYAGAARLLELTGQPVVINRSSQAVRRLPGLMVLTPRGPGQLDGLDMQHDRLIVLPKWRAAADPDHPGWVRATEAMSAAEAVSVLPKKIGGGLTLRRRPSGAGATLTSDLALWPQGGVGVGPVTGLQTMHGGRFATLIQDETGGMILGAAPGGHVYVLSDPDLLDTQGLADRRTARAALLMLLALRDDGQPIAFDATLGGAGGRSLLRLAFEPPFLGATLCLAIAATLVGLHGWNRFGAPQPAERALALGKLALAENGAGMMRLARREPRMAGRYVQLCRQRVAVLLGASQLQGEALDEFLDRWAERVKTPDRITALMAEARQVNSVTELMVLAQRARRWRLEMTRELG